MKRWNTDYISDLTGKRVVITGASSGLGLEAAKVLTSKGAEVIMALRSLTKGERAVSYICEKNPNARIRLMQVNMDSIISVKNFTREFLALYNSLDILINNAGVMVPPFSKNADNIEIQFATNHLGHFALTGLLMPALKMVPGARVVTVSSIASRSGDIDFDNLDGSKGYSAMKFYCQSKYANLLFGIELDKRLKDSGTNILSVVCHPGVSATNLASRGSGKEEGTLFKYMFNMIAQSAQKGTLPLLYAAANEEITGGEYIGPGGFQNMWGYPQKTSEGEKLFNKETANKLWSVSEQLTQVKVL
jgi:NAD(P)-dependent dehydrogenase (short-subunit alcohol dehydrogenase family)